MSPRRGEGAGDGTSRGLASFRVVVAGHMCLDVIPELPAGAAFAPGTLTEVGPAAFASGGAVSNVGLALTKLGLRPTLVGKVGDDHFGKALLEILRESGADLAVQVADGESTSYSIVLNPPERDRSFLHHPGCNHTFAADDLQTERWLEADLVHFGYPPLMSGIYRDDGISLAAAFAQLRSHGVTISLDMAMPDPSGASGKVDWRSFLHTVLPHVDLFLPSWEEVLFMLDPDTRPAPPSAEGLARVSGDLLHLGVAVVGLKLGDDGLYLRAAGAERLAHAGRAAPDPSWAKGSHHAPNFRVAAKGTTGAGDSTIAGLLAAIVQGMDMVESGTMAAAVGASSVEGVDAVSGVRSWAETAQRVAAGWPRNESRFTAERGGEA